MPANATGTISINKDVDTYVATLARGGFYEFSPQDSTVRFRDLPANVASVGLNLQLPDNPSDGDTYEFIDADGSCGGANNILCTIQDAGATGRVFAGVPALSIPALITNATKLLFPTPHAGAKFQFDAEANAWIVWVNPIATVAATFNIAGTLVGNGAVTPDNFAGGAAEILCAFLVQPGSTGFFRLDAMLSGILAAADTDLKVEISVVPDVTAFSGGAVVGPATAPTMRYVSGSPVVVTGGAPVVWGSWQAQEATGDIGHITATLATLVAAPKPTVANAIGAAIVLKLSSAVQAFNTLSLLGNVQEAA